MSEVKKTLKIGEGKAGPGRPKGVLNKTTQTAKDTIAMAAEGLGGYDRLLAWAQEDPSNEKAFWATIYPKLLPLQVNSDTTINGSLDIKKIVINPIAAKIV